MFAACSSSTILGREWIPDLSHLLDVEQRFRLP
jgi:hypothetical protein